MPHTCAEPDRRQTHLRSKQDARALKVGLARVAKERLSRARDPSNPKANRYPHGTRRPREEVLRDDWAMTHRVKAAARQELRSTLRSIWQEQGNLIVRRLREVQRSGRTTRAMRAAWQYARGSEGSKEDPDQAIHRLIIQRLIEWETWKERIREETGPLLQRIIEQGGETGAVRVGVSGVDFTSGSPFVQQQLSEILGLVESTEDTWSSNLARTIQQGLSEGDDFEGLVARAREQQEYQTGSRLRRTVETVGNGGFEAGQLQAWRDVGLSERSWVTERDVRVRGTAQDVWDHRGADGQTQPLSQPFIIVTTDGFTSESLMYPAAPEASAANAVNCRCSQSPELEEGNLPESLR